MGRSGTDNRLGRMYSVACPLPVRQFGNFPGIRSRSVAIITLKHRTLSPVVQLFIDHARMVAKTMRQ